MDLNVLVMQRISAVVMSSLFSKLGINQMAHNFISDDDRDWVVVNEGEVRVIRDLAVVATISYNYSQGYSELGLPGGARVVIPDIFAIVRDGHLYDFEPSNYGLVHNTATDWKGDKANDLDVSIILEDMDNRANELQAPRKKVLNQQARWPKLKGSLGRFNDGIQNS